MLFLWINRWSTFAVLLCFTAAQLPEQMAPLRIEDVIRVALEKSPQVQAAQASLEAARSSRTTAATLPNPLLPLFGVAVLNGVVLILYITRLRTGGRSLDDAVREGAELQLRAEKA